MGPMRPGNRQWVEICSIAGVTPRQAGISLAWIVDMNIVERYFWMYLVYPMNCYLPSTYNALKPCYDEGTVGLYHDAHHKA